MVILMTLYPTLRYDGVKKYAFPHKGADSVGYVNGDPAADRNGSVTFTSRPALAR